jgi:hypothetical protein
MPVIQRKITRTPDQCAQDLHAVARELQHYVRGIVPLVDKLRDADQRFLAAISSYPPGFEPGSITFRIHRYIELALFAESDGGIRVPRVIESSFQIRGNGLGDIEKHARDYTAVALRDYSPPHAAKVI